VKVKPLVFKRKRMMRILIPDGLRFVGLKTDLHFGGYGFCRPKDRPTFLGGGLGVVMVLSA
jgi:hypothetical protein